MLKLSSQTIGKFCLGLDFGHFNTLDSLVDPIIHDISAMLVLNKRVTTRGEWGCIQPIQRGEKLPKPVSDLKINF
jgi:hypothetical protein